MNIRKDGKEFKNFLAWLHERPIPTKDQVIKFEQIRLKLLAEATARQREEVLHEEKLKERKDHEENIPVIAAPIESKDSPPINPKISKTNEDLLPSGQITWEQFEALKKSLEHKFSGNSLTPSLEINSSRLHCSEFILGGGNCGVCPFCVEGQAHVLININQTKQTVKLMHTGFDRKRLSTNPIFVYEDTVILASPKSMQFWRLDGESLKLFHEYLFNPEEVDIVQKKAFFRFEAFFNPDTRKILVHIIWGKQRLYVINADKALIENSQVIHNESPICTFAYPDIAIFWKSTMERDFWKNHTFYDQSFSIWKVKQEGIVVHSRCKLGSSDSEFQSLMGGHLWYSNYFNHHKGAYLQFNNDKLYVLPRLYEEKPRTLRGTPFVKKLCPADPFLSGFVANSSIRRIIHDYAESPYYSYLEVLPKRYRQKDELTMLEELQDRINSLAQQIKASEHNPQYKNEINMKKLLYLILCDFQNMAMKEDLVDYNECIKRLKNKYATFFNTAGLGFFSALCNKFSAEKDIVGLCYEAVKFIHRFKECDKQYGIHEPNGLRYC